ncbi:hypothetical protein [Mycobacterium hubeiense]|uniref:hypothetical protein n=1 Tax=Mycobacterium hubeiense TaxID=1867256 RepID=UPI000C7F3356|nr:hypothetical protein [Mycobacterium sp. QGD 101]
MPTPEDWWPNFPPTPKDHRPKKPDIWCRRFDNHINDTIRALDQRSTEAVKGREFQAALLRAHSQYLSSQPDGARHFLEEVYAIASRAFTFYTARNNAELDPLISKLRFDLAGLAEVLSS